MATYVAARLYGLFAANAAVCVIARRGPTHFSQLILWNTETDVFTTGQWIHGNVTSGTLSSDGKYAALCIVGGKTKSGFYPDGCYMVICRPPFFTALEFWEGYSRGDVSFREGDVIAWPGSEYPHEHRSRTKCPFQVTTSKIELPKIVTRRLTQGYGEQILADQQGRLVKFEAGAVYDVSRDEPRLLCNLNPNKFEEVISPDWARHW